MVSLLYGPSLNWEFVENNTESSTELFAWTPVIVSTALNISQEHVLTFALQLYEPSSYQGVADASQLGTVWLAYIPNEQVSNLADQIKDVNSAFYTALGQPYKSLAGLIDPSFAVDSVQAPSNSDGGSSSSNSQSASSSGSSNKTREDVIIGVVTSLGALTLIVLVFLVLRSVKQRRELAHRRLSDPNAGANAQNVYVGARPDGQDFDQDSIGGQRRRSFYYAADSLRGFSDTATSAAGTTVSPDAGMRERRTVMPGMIGTPVLRDNTGGW
ncbi:hypothetical protein B0H21DRAFT_821903 [Amylocystis lapponica]|nr:hypothetical protein B0H21DRAFT_821903 [Amylocystis lapponica]